MTDTVAQPALKESALKDIFDRARIQAIAGHLADLSTAFDRARFLEAALRDLDDLALMARLGQVSGAIHAALDLPVERALDVLRDLAPRMGSGFATLILPDWVARFASDDTDRALDALAFFTRFGSSEFGIRPFIRRDPAHVLGVMTGWTADASEHVRRLASEGARPRLPWSFRLEAVVADPALTWPILDRLKTDPAIYVRRSVANHLNDVSKDHPDWLLDRLAGWDRDHPHIAWIIRHGLRSRIKAGDARALALVGADRPAELRVEAAAITPARIRSGDRITLAVDLVSTAAVPQRLVIDYAIGYVRPTGISRKVFKLRTVDLGPGERLQLSRSQVIRDFSTRRHHPGHHAVELLVNGAVLAVTGFDLGS
ncbi:DNA alkylation repair protein [Tistrella mobilis]